MRRFLCPLLGVLFGCTLAQAQHLVFTMRTFPTCPVLISSIESSPEYGFQSLSVLDDSGKGIASIRLSVVLTLGSDEQVVDGGTVYVNLQPGDHKDIDVFLGQRRSLMQAAQELHLSVARAIVFVESVDFADGTRWDPGAPAVDLPAWPLRQK